MTRSQRAERVRIDEELIKEAADMEIDLSRAAEAGIARAVATKKQAREWAEENAEAIRSSNEYVEKHGLPLARYRMF